jgi:hypothetical protein
MDHCTGLLPFLYGIRQILLIGPPNDMALSRHWFEKLVFTSIGTAASLGGFKVEVEHPITSSPQRLGSGSPFMSPVEDKNEALENLYERRSVRSCREEAPSDAELREIIKLARSLRTARTPRD